MDRVRFVQGCLVVGAIVLFGAVLAASIQGTVRDVETLVRVPYPGLDPATTYLGADSLPLVPLELDDSGRFVGVPDIADDQLLWYANFNLERPRDPGTWPNHTDDNLLRFHAPTSGSRTWSNALAGEPVRPDAFPDTSPHGSHSTVYAYASWRSEGLDRDDQRIIVVVMRTADPIEAPNMTDDELAETLHRFTVEDPNGRGRFIAFHASCRWFDHELVRIGPPPSSFPPDDPWCGGAWVNFHHDRLTWGEVRYFPSQL